MNLAQEPGKLTPRRAGFELVIASFVVLFQELALIRWLPAQVRVVAYFPNLILISAFLGLGVGSLRARRRSLLWGWPVGLALIVVVAALLSRVAFTANQVSEHLWLLYSDLPEGAPVVNGVRLPIVALFILSALSFVPLGQVVAERLNVFGERSSPLWGYVFDLSGSLLGVVGFAFVSLSGVFPVIWFAVVFLAGGVLFLRKRLQLALYVVVVAGVLWRVQASEHAQYYSPYYALSAVPTVGTTDYIIRANGSFHQVAAAVRESDPILTESRARARQGYHLPYKLLGHPPGNVLVLGAGTGNDVAVLLDEGATHIDAVEIDPVILALGKKLHPDHPWDDPRVRIINTDARSFLRETHERYDLVVFGTLDSMTRLSALSNVRLDNFVYTQESIRAAYHVLKPGGGMVLYFEVGKEHIFYSIAALLYVGTGELPVVFQGKWEVFSHVFVVGPAFAQARRDPRRVNLNPLLPRIAAAAVPSDDWPYLYLPARAITPFYVSLMAVFLALAVAGVMLASPEMRRDVLKGRGMDGEMFLFGLAFLLLETRFVTAINLLWGATWITSAVVFGAILATLLVTTVLMELRPIPWRVATTGLVVTLVAIYLIPTGSLIVGGRLTRLALSVVFVGTPIFFAAACFASRFRTRKAVDLAFGWNLLGAVTGGLVEFFSMVVGLKALTLVALVAYAGAFLLKERDDRGAQAPEASASPAG